VADTNSRPILSSIEAGEPLTLMEFVLRTTHLREQTEVPDRLFDNLRDAANNLLIALDMPAEELKAHIKQAQLQNADRLAAYRNEQETFNRRLAGASRQVCNWNPPPELRDLKKSLVTHLRDTSDAVRETLNDLPAAPRRESLSDYRLRVIGNAADNLKIACQAFCETAGAAMKAQRLIDDVEASLKPTTAPVWAASPDDEEDDE